jgi:hypothetical protein
MTTYETETARSVVVVAAMSSPTMTMRVYDGNTSSTIERIAVDHALPTAHRAPLTTAYRSMFVTSPSEALWM